LVKAKLEMQGRLVLTGIDEGAAFRRTRKVVRLEFPTIANPAGEEQIRPLKTEIGATLWPRFGPIVFNVSVIHMRDVTFAVRAFSMKQSHQSFLDL